MIELADIVRRHGPEYLARRGASMPWHHRRALGAILTCRTPARGGHLYVCAHCAHPHFGAHSCNHRSCPKCGGAGAAEWEARQKAKLLPAPYFMMTFTLPEELRAVCQRHQQLFYSLLFSESSAALQEVAAQPRHLGAELGFFGVLHTWTRQLAYHPHIHYVIPGGGLRADHRRWRKCRVTAKGMAYLLPVQVLSRRFRNRFAAALRKQAPELYREIPAGAWRREWVVNSQACGRGEPVIGYLAGYVTRTTLSNKRLLADEDGRITFSYKESGSGARRTMQLPALAFLARVLSHVLPPGLHKVRYFGWLHPAARRRFLIVQTLLEVPLVFNAAPETPPLPAHLCCPHCGEYRLVWIRRLPGNKDRPP